MCFVAWVKAKSMREGGLIRVTNESKLTESRVPHLTFDTSCIVSLLGCDNTPADKLIALRQILEWEKLGKVRIWISEKSRTESQFNLKRARGHNILEIEQESKWLETLSYLNKYPVTKPIWILGISKAGVDTVPASDEQGQIYDEMMSVIFPDKDLREMREGDVYDMAILFEHYLQENDLFVTRDKKSILKAKVKTELRKKWGIRIVSPIEAQRYCNLIVG